MGRFRLSVATLLTFAASRVAPRSMRPVFVAYVKMLDGYEAQLAMGRTFGVLTVPWSTSQEHKGKARVMQHRMLAVGAKVRAGIEAIAKVGE